MSRLILFALVAFLALCAGCSTRRASVPPAAPSPKGDLLFVTGLLRHQNAAVQILDLCRSRSERAELRQACSTGLDSLQKRKAQLSEWIRAWSGQAETQASTHDDQYKSFYDQMRAAKNNEFDEAAARAIRVHAREGVTESASCQLQAADPELRAFCADLNAGQTRALNNARRWICEWFKDCTEFGSR